MLDGVLEEIYEIMKKQYLYAKNNCKLVTSVTRLVDAKHGTAIRSLREGEEKKV